MPYAERPFEAAPVSVPLPPESCSRWWQNRWEALGWILFVGLLAGFVPHVLRRLTQLAGSDFWLFCDSARYIWEHGSRAPNSKFSHYLPSVDVAFILLAWLPLRWAAVAWFGIMTTGWLCLLAAVRRYLLYDYDGTQARRSLLCAGLIVLPLFLDLLCVGAFHVLMVWFMVAGLGRISQNKPWSGGLVLGLAVWVKLLPLLGVGYLVLKRKWLPAALTLVVALSVDLALSLATLGPEGTWQSHCLWLESEVFGASNQLLSNPRPLDDDRITNQSAMVVMRRILTRMGHGTPADREAADAARLGITVKPGWVGSVNSGRPRPNVSVAELTAGQLQTAYTTAMLLLAAAIAFYCRRPGRDLLPRRWATEISLIVLATLWFSPLVWSYHPTAALPAVAVIFARAPQHSKLAVAVAALWLLSLALMGSPLARALGVTLWMDLLLGIFLVWSACNEMPTLVEERSVTLCVCMRATGPARALRR